jgi:hypothetical protein
MYGPEPKVFTDNLLRIEVCDRDRGIEVKWLGKSTQREPGRFITPLLGDVIDASSESNKPVVLDFRGLGFMNSSTITPVIKLLDRAKQGQVKLTLLYDKSSNWQDLNFSALRIFETEDRRIEVRAL